MRLIGGALVLPDRIVSPGTLVIEGGRIEAVLPGWHRVDGAGVVHVPGCYIVPGFIDAHVHGVEGFDTLGEGRVVAEMARRFPKFGVTAFAPTVVACRPDQLGQALDQVRRAREAPEPDHARVLPAHFESNFISPEWCGAQPASVLLNPREALAGLSSISTVLTRRDHVPDGLFDDTDRSAFDGPAILHEIVRADRHIGMVTVAPELEGGIELVEWLVARGIGVGLGHSGATYERALEAITSGARRGTHVFNRMAPIHQRAPGLASAILQARGVDAEIICDGHHVHPGLVRVAIAAKGAQAVLAVTDGTALSGCPAGSRGRLGTLAIHSTPEGAFLDDGTRAGSTLTMDGAFRTLVRQMEVSIVDAALMCATTPARAVGLDGAGAIEVGAFADLVVLDASLSVRQTYVAGQLAYDGAVEAEGPAETNRLSR